MNKRHLTVLPTPLTCTDCPYTVPTWSYPIEWHDDKPDGRPDLHVTTQPGDLDLAGRPLRQGR